MKKYALAICLALPLLGACNNSTTTAINNVLATLAKNDIPTACGIITVAEGYFNTLESELSVAEIADEAKAVLVVNSFCPPNTPTNITAAFGSLLSAWTAIQADTTVPVTPTPAPTPTPTPTSN